MSTKKKPTPIPGNMPIQDTPFGLHIANNITKCRTFIDSLKSFYEVDDVKDLNGFFRDMPEEIEHHRNVHNHVWYVVHNLDRMQYDIRQEFHAARAELYAKGGEV